MADENRPSQNVNNDCNNNNLSGGQIALIIIGCLLIIGVVAALIAWLMQDRKKSKSNSSKQQIVQIGGQFSPNDTLQKQDTQNQQTPNTNQPTEPAKQTMPDYNENLNNQLVNQMITEQMAMNQNNMVADAQKPLYTIPENNPMVAEKPKEELKEEEPEETKKEEPKQDDLEDSFSEQSADDIEEDIKQNDDEEKKDEKQEAKQSDEKTNTTLADLLSGTPDEKPIKVEANDVDGGAPATQNQNLQFPADFTYTLKDFEKLAQAGKLQNPFQQMPLEKEIDNINWLKEQHKPEEEQLKKEEQLTNNKPLAQLGNAFSEPELKLKMQNPEENLPSPEQPISNKANRELPTLDQVPMSINMPMMAPNTNNQDNVVSGGNDFNFIPKPQQNNFGANNTVMQMGDGNNMPPKMNEIGANNNAMPININDLLGGLKFNKLANETKEEQMQGNDMMFNTQQPTEIPEQFNDKKANNEMMPPIFRPQQNNIGVNNNFMQMGDGNNMPPKMNERGANNNAMSMDDDNFGNNMPPVFDFMPKSNNVNRPTNENEKPMQGNDMMFNAQQTQERFDNQKEDDEARRPVFNLIPRPQQNNIGVNNNAMSMDDDNFDNNVPPVFNFTPKPNNVNQSTNANKEPMQEGMSANAMFGEKPKEEQKPMTLNNLLGGMKFNQPANANKEPMRFTMDNSESQMEKKDPIMNIGMDMSKQDDIGAQQQELNNQMLMNNGVNMPIQQNKNDAGNIKPEPINEDDIKPDTPPFDFPPMMNMENNNEDKHKMIEEDDIQKTPDGMENPFMTQPLLKEKPEMEEKEEMEKLPMPSQAICQNKEQEENNNKVNEGTKTTFIRHDLPMPNITMKKEINNSMLNGLPGINSNMPMEQTNNGQSQTNLETQNKCMCPDCTG